MSIVQYSKKIYNSVWTTLYTFVLIDALRALLRAFFLLLVHKSTNLGRFHREWRSLELDLEAEMLRFGRSWVGTMRA